jgi:putative nucleotidyltransferase with HDIG domain
VAGNAVDRDAGWNARPYAAALLRASTLLVPVAASVAFVYVGARVVPPPASSLALYLGWWLGLSFLATLVLLAVGRLFRRLLPLATLLKLSLAFPDATPSRFRTAVATRTVGTLAEGLADAQDAATPEGAGRRLLALVAALDDHDGLTRGHSERVRAYAQLIGTELGLNKHELDLLNWAALLHDIGKLEIPRAILNQTGKPTEEEWATIRKHPEFGAALVAPLAGWLGEWSRAVLDHHERWDGAGYPHGTVGTEISLAGRIVAVADVFDVITSTRSYKPSSTMAAARSEIARCAGTQFDPDVVRAFLAVSFGRARLVAGPGAWLAQAALLARIPLTSAAGTLSAAAVVGVSVVPGGVVERNAGQPGTAPSRAGATVTSPAASAPAPRIVVRPRAADTQTEAPAKPTRTQRSRPQPTPTPSRAKSPEPAPPPPGETEPVVVPSNPSTPAPTPTPAPPTTTVPPAKQPSQPTRSPAAPAPPSPPASPEPPAPPTPPEPPSPPPAPSPPPVPSPPSPPPAPTPPPVPEPPAVPTPPVPPPPRVPPPPPVPTPPPLP